MKYSSHWLATIVAAVILHFVAAIIFEFVLPKIFPAHSIKNISEINWVDVELVDDVPIIDEEILLSEPKESSTPFEFAPIELPPLIEPPKFEPPEISKPPEPAPPKEEEPPKKSAPVEEPPEEQVLVSDPITISAVYPEKSFGFKGIVSVSVTIGKDGKIKNAEVIMPSGIEDVDNIALESAQKWTFKPALDQNNKPMERVKIIIFDFTKISD